MVDPDYLIVERDPEVLHAYARRLLHLLRNRRSYSFEMVKAATVWLIGAYVDARVPLAPEVYGLIAGVVKWNPRANAFRQVQEKNENAYRAAIRFEASRPADPTGKAPSAATLYAVAKYVREGVGFPQQGTRRSKIKDSEPAPNAAQKSAEATIRGWRKLQHYRQNVLLQRVREVGTFNRQHDHRQRVERDPEGLHAYARRLLHLLRNPSRNYSFEKVKAATVRLIGAYVDARVPLAPEVYGLISVAVKWNRRASTFRQVQEKNENAYWAAIRFEASRPADPTGKAPSAATLYAVAKYVREGVGFPQQGTRRSKIKDSEPAPNAAQKSAEATIRGWRKLPHYRRNVLLQRDAGAYFRQMRDFSDGVK
jgi:hypothetical protein